MNSEEDSPQAGEKVRRPAKPISPFGAAITALVMSLVISAATVKVYHDQFATKVVTIDMREYVDTLGKEMMAGKIDRAGVEVALKELNRRIQEDMPPGTIVLLDDVVVTDVSQIRP